MTQNIDDEKQIEINQTVKHACVLVRVSMAACKCAYLCAYGCVHVLL